MEQWNRPPKALSPSPPSKNVVLGCPPTLLGVLGLGFWCLGRSFLSWIQKTKKKRTFNVAGREATQLRGFWPQLRGPPVPSLLKTSGSETAHTPFGKTAF